MGLSMIDVSPDAEGAELAPISTGQLGLTERA